MIRLNYILRFLVGFAICVAVGGCMLGPDYERPGTAADERGFFRAPAEWVDAEAAQTGKQWWKGFDDPVIDELVEKALVKNNSIKAAGASVIEAGALLDQSKGVRLPGVNYSFNRRRAKSVLGIPMIPSFITEQYSHQLDVSYIADVFGKLKRAERAAFADLAGAEANREAIVHAVIAQVVRTRVMIATQQRLYGVATATVQSREKTLEIIERRYPLGLVNSVDIYLARENIAAAQSLRPQFKQSIMLAQHGLDVLVGQRPGSSDELDETLADLPDLSPVPLGLSVGLLERRPDVRAAEMQLAAATERVGFNIASMYPDLTLGATAGYQADTIRMLTSSQNQFYSAVLAVAAPVFRGGQLKAQVRAAEARVERAAANYADVVLNAIREVEDALVTERMQYERMGFVASRFEEATQAEKLAVESYGKGVGNILAVLETERRRQIAENELVLTKGQLYNARIDLFLALGGDWGVEDVKADDESEQ